MMNTNGEKKVKRKECKRKLFKEEEMSGELCEKKKEDSERKKEDVRDIIEKVGFCWNTFLYNNRFINLPIQYFNYIPLCVLKKIPMHELASIWDKVPHNLKPILEEYLACPGHCEADDIFYIRRRDCFNCTSL